MSRTVRKHGVYWYFVDHVAPLSGAEPVVRLWVALPFDRPGQRAVVRNLAPAPTRIVEDPYGGNRIACFEVREIPPEGRLVFRVDFEVEATEVRTEFDPATVEPYDRESAEYERFTRSEPWIEITDDIAATAREVAGGETNPLLAARRVFDWVVREMRYEYPEDSDRGAARSFARRKGDCGEFSFVFVAMCRALGIPARTVTCNWFTGFGHMWAEFLCPPRGWIPADTSVAEAVSRGEMSEFCSRREVPSDDPGWFFGNLYADRLVVYVGTNVPVGDRTFAFLQPGGVSAAPEAFEAEGFEPGIVHNGFYLFDEGCDDPQKAGEAARREMAKAHFDAGHPEDAEEGFRLVIAERPKDSLAWFHLGQIHMNRVEFGRARECFTNCVEGEGGSIQPVLGALATLLRGQCYDLEGRREEAVADYRALLESGVEFGDSADQARRYLETPYRGEEG